jgi:hypothetical protein
MGSLLQGLMPSASSTSTPTAGTTSNSRVINYPGTDPYYGITISDLAIPQLESTPDDTGGLGFQTDPRKVLMNKSYPNSPMYPGLINYNKNGVQQPTLDDLKNQAKWYNENYPGWQANVDSTYNFFNASNYKPTGSSKSTKSGSTGGKFRIAKPNMTWVNNMPSVMPAGGAALAAKYGPMPFSTEANTPYPVPVPRGLTYNNPYNTNPYLPTANPFALIANSPTSQS